eukprot:gene26911-29599_t
MKRVMREAMAQPESVVRWVGFAALVAGVALVWLIRGSMILRLDWASIGDVAMTLHCGRALKSFCFVAAVAAALMVPAWGAAPALAGPFKAPDSVADLTEGLLDSVVYIQTSQTTKAERQLPAPTPGPAPKAPDGSPFQEFFDDFFNKQQQKNKEQPPARVQSVGSGCVIDESGIVITNNHVIDGADDIQITFQDG